jgi:BarA-like signal transduction histidine kinase
MSKLMKIRNLILLLPAFLAAPSFGADTLAKDLTSTIALLGLPCGQVVSAQRLKDNDYIATCQDKNRYRVFINEQGRVVAQKQ